MLLLYTPAARRASRRRRRIADGLTNAVARARRPRLALSAQVPVDRSAVADSADRLLALAAVLRSPRELPAEGVAAAHRLLTDGGGPLYLTGERLPQTLTRIEIALGLR